jgi:signal transduction histidine kinase
MGILGHDLRNPLSTITCAAALLLQHSDLPCAAHGSMDRIAANADRISRMVRDLLDLARCRLQGGLPVDPSPMDLVALCRQIIDELELAHPGREIRLEAPRRAPGTWDPDRLGEVISNLLGNALAHSPDDTPVCVRVRERRRSVKLAIHNEGPPIPEEVRATLFEPYRRPEHGAPSGRGSSGLKLGLFIAREIVRAHGGTIGIESESGRGTTVVVSLPKLGR